MNSLIRKKFSVVLLTITAVILSFAEFCPVVYANSDMGGMDNNSQRQFESLISKVTLMRVLPRIKKKRKFRNNKTYEDSFRIYMHISGLWINIKITAKQMVLFFKFGSLNDSA